MRSAEALVLVGGSTEPQSIVAHSSEATVQAKKLLLEARPIVRKNLLLRSVLQPSYICWVSRLMKAKRIQLLISVAG
jgi:hypothetical protein